MSEEERKALEIVLNEHRDYVFDSNKLMSKHIDEVVDDMEARKQLQEDCLKERHLALNMIGFVKQNLEQFVKYCTIKKDK